MTLDHIVKLKLEISDKDLPAWQWLFHLIKTLGEHGMSLEESTVENDIEHILQIKQMDWQQYIDWELEITDTEHLVDNDIFPHQGARPVKRIHAYNNPSSSRDPGPGLPMTLYDSVWVASLT